MKFMANAECGPHVLLLRFHASDTHLPMQCVAYFWLASCYLWRIRARAARARVHCNFLRMDHFILALDKLESQQYLGLHPGGKYKSRLRKRSSNWKKTFRAWCSMRQYLGKAFWRCPGGLLVSWWSPAGLLVVVVVEVLLVSPGVLLVSSWPLGGLPVVRRSSGPETGEGKAAPRPQACATKDRESARERDRES